NGTKQSQPSAGAPHAGPSASYRQACSTTTTLLSRRGLDNRSCATLASQLRRAGSGAEGVPARPWPRDAPRPVARAADLRAGAAVDTPLGDVGGADGQTGGTKSGSAWNDSPVPPDGGRSITHLGLSVTLVQPSSCS